MAEKKVGCNCREGNATIVEIQVREGDGTGGHEAVALVRRARAGGAGHARPRGRRGRRLSTHRNAQAGEARRRAAKEADVVVKEGASEALGSA